jgi:lysozyme
MNNVVDLVKKHEGLRLYCYDDATGARLDAGDTPKGKPTIGYGHAGPDVVPGLVIDQKEADSMLGHDIISAQGDCAWVFGRVWVTFLPARQAAFTDMAFNVGRTGISEFQRMIHAALAGDWAVAALEALSSKWADQVGARAEEDASMIKTGEWPSADPQPPMESFAT